MSSAAKRSLRSWIAAAGLLALLGAALVNLAREVAPTADERLYFTCGHHLVTEADWSAYHARYQGPLGLYPNQLFAGDVDPSAYVSLELADDLPRGRYGIVVLTLAAAAATFLVARSLFGDGAGLLALGLFVSNPMLLGHGALVTVDMPHTLATLAATAALLYHLRAPAFSRALLVGAACGAALATKYLAAVFGPLVALLALLGSLVAGSAAPGAGRLRRVGADFVALVAAGLLTLHAAYLFTQPFSPPLGAAYQSATLGGLDLPLIRELIRPLPLALSQGVDLMLSVDDKAVDRWSYFLGEYRDSVPSYYVVALAVKVPLLLLIATGLGAAVALRRGVAPGGFAVAPVPVLAVLILVPIAILSLATTYKLGVRYILQLMPLMAILGGACAPGLAGLPRPLARLAAVLGLALLVPVGHELSRTWPNAIAYYNLAAGGTAAGAQYFADSNTEWNQLAEVGLAELEAELGPLDVLTRTAGPRLGRVAIYVEELIPSTATSAGPPGHWLGRFEPVARRDAAWFVYDLEAEDFEAAIAAGADLRRDAAIAYLGAGQLDRAALHVATLAPSDPVARLAQVLAGDRSADPATTVARARLWNQVGRNDIAARMLAALPGPPTDDALALHALALSLDRRLHEAAELLADRATPDKHPISFLYGAKLQTRLWREQEAIAAVEAAMAVLPPAVHEQAREIVRAARHQADNRPEWTRGFD